jgi:hypothetical protein
MLPKKKKAPKKEPDPSTLGPDAQGKGEAKRFGKHFLLFSFSFSLNCQSKLHHEMFL